jgi:hypothetical protein
MGNLKELNENELQEANGGWLLLVEGALVAGTVYSYVKEKIDSGQW